jgi:uncharacterized membrane protein
MRRLFFIFIAAVALICLSFYAVVFIVPELQKAAQGNNGEVKPVAVSGAGAKELKLCNGTASRVGVAIGYKDSQLGWTSEGWWNVDSQSCDILIPEKLKARYYYVHAIDYDRGGEWGGAINMCTDDKEFTIRGVENCESRGYKKSGFFEVDTMDQTGWTVKLTEQGDATSASTGADSVAR